MSENITLTPESLRTLAFLTQATDEELRMLLPAAQIEQYPSGCTIFHEGDHINHVFVVAAGTVALEINGVNHTPRRIQTLHPGELLGWSPLLGTGAMTASAKALTQVRVVAFNAKILLELCERDPKFGFLLMRRTAAAIAARLSATRLQLLDVYGAELHNHPVGAR
jgi:CRP-like cAMP-binding protein